uniref:bifunctional diguanylate cyclase/phosphodiesterase n=1 Tax=Thaumasiovibrio occultus TaxID=1891184 RepID=UPI000B3543A8|nr:EAL domain-containing protein [Thaumasiovibrio occultus]
MALALEKTVPFASIAALSPLLSKFVLTGFIIISAWISTTLINYSQVLTPIWLTSMIAAIFIGSRKKQEWLSLLITALLSYAFVYFLFLPVKLVSFILILNHGLFIVATTSLAGKLLFRRAIYRHIRSFFTGLCITLLLPAVIVATLSTVIIVLWYNHRFSELWFAWMVNAVIGGIPVLSLAVANYVYQLDNEPPPVFTANCVLSILAVVLITMAAYSNLPAPHLYISAALILFATFSSLTTVSVLIAVTSLAAYATIILSQHITTSQLIAWENSQLFAQLFLTLVPPLILSVSLTIQQRLRKRLKTVFLRSQSVYKNAPFAMAIYDEQGSVVAANDQCLKLLGYSEDEFIGNTITQHIYPASQQYVERITDEYFFSESENARLKFRRKDGSRLEVDLSTRQYAHAIDNLNLTLAVLKDASTEAQLSKELDQEQKLLGVTLNSISDAVIVTDKHGNITFVNPAATSLFDLNAHDLIGHPFSHYIYFSQSDDVSPLKDPIASCLLTQTRYNEEHCLYFQPSALRTIDIDLSVSPIFSNKQLLIGTVMICRDISEQRQSAKAIEHLAKHDVLTGLSNRSQLIDRLEHACERHQRNERQFGLMFIDLDHFKRINDSLGHEVGDVVLTTVASRLRSTVRKSDTVSRLGGDEFVLVLEDLDDTQSLAHICQKIQRALAEPIELDTIGYVITASIGVSIYPTDGADPTLLLRHADNAMYRSKQRGRAQSVFYSEEMEEESRHRLDIERYLRLGVEKNAFYLQFQPIVHGKNYQLEALEGRCQWSSDLPLQCTPRELIHVAEETHLIFPLGRSLLNSACQQLKLLSEYDRKDVRIALNINALQVSDNNFVDSIEELLAFHHVSASSFIFEITEAVLIKNPELSLATVKRLRELGAKITLDEFGTGYSSLNYLKLFPVDMIKIDRTFIKDITTSEQDRAFVLAILEIARTLSLEVIAQGVENAKQADVLKEMGCHYLQGRYYTKAWVSNPWQLDDSARRMAMPLSNR